MTAKLLPFREPDDDFSRRYRAWRDAFNPSRRKGVAMEKCPEESGGTWTYPTDFRAGRVAALGFRVLGVCDE